MLNDLKGSQNTHLHHAKHVTSSAKYKEQTIYHRRTLQFHIHIPILILHNRIRNLLGLLINFVHLAPNKPLRREERVLEVNHCLPLPDLPYQTITGLVVRHHRRRRPLTLNVGHDRRLATLHHRHDGVGSAEVDPHHRIRSDEMLARETKKKQSTSQFLCSRPLALVLIELLSGRQPATSVLAIAFSLCPSKKICYFFLKRSHLIRNKLLLVIKPKAMAALDSSDRVPVAES
ncbi:protein kinase superfamily protein [Striga asiatica]|uniref:Protein kinase superfamily protein n=1 Tax=Striga asiatica TaxID=4170 RepID=A0A5A7QKL5_STRAF|nr:protein kinase superfamily protein [Striga asiatica]